MKIPGFSAEVSLLKSGNQFEDSIRQNAPNKSLVLSQLDILDVRSRCNKIGLIWHCFTINNPRPWDPPFVCVQRWGCTEWAP